ncbi:nitrogenase component 1 [Clostridium kluyveri]|uniref:Nitrogenase associated protein N n=1 Tax=Clostridium kluyveri TaxID=1534 RepID=A0A1L5F857_CLOKL|nr:nitrogenase component 1 [Clostridium kluyveri]APM39162.1 nitrogenase associated protein N [Clostridium kluyveri]UZQ51489.1 nitrogenase associated protein N [Clostridium kluyveri]
MYDELKFHNCEHSKDPVLGCALEGVASVIAGIDDVSIVIHSPQGCAATVANAYDLHEIDFTRRKVGCTRLFETDVIMGASEKLKQLIKDADNTFSTKTMFVVGTCAADIIGEDIEGICKSMQPEVKARLIPIVAGGFRGNSYDGQDIALNAIIPLIKKSKKKYKNSVNIISPQANLNPTWWEDLNWVIKTLNSLGINVQAVLPHNTSMEEIENSASASANILLSHDAGYQFAKKMEKIHHIPLILSDIPLPIGTENTARWLRAIGMHFGVEDKVEQIIKEGEEKVISLLRKRALMIIPRYRNCRIAISADATMGIGLVRMLFKELEMIPEIIMIKSDKEEAKKVLNWELSTLGISPKVAFSVDGYQIKKGLSDFYVDTVIGSAWEKYMAEEIGIKVAFDVLNPTNRDIYVDRAYLGYDGMLNILEIMGNDWERAYRSKEISWAQYE